MTSRLRSSAGSFVRSPKGAFETVGVLHLATVNFIFDDPGSSWGLFPGCLTAGIGAGSTGNSGFLFEYLSPRPTSPADVIGYLHVGQSSGTNWRPSDLTLALNCTQADGTEIWLGAASVPVGGGLVYQHHVEITVVSGEVRTLTRYANYGEHPGTIVEPFIALESVQVTG